jgi:diadenosine tetraphosphate (Ap4A) HIT family hydrolase
MPIEIPPSPGGWPREERPSPDAECYNCEVIEDRFEKIAVEETEHTVTLLNPAQFELGQVVVHVRRHAPTLLDLTDEEGTAVMRAVRRVADALVRAYDLDGMNLIQNNGVIAGQTAPHFHMHVVPRRKVGSHWGDGPPHILAIEGKKVTKPKPKVLVSVEREHEIVDYIKRHMP